MFLNCFDSCLGYFNSKNPTKSVENYKELLPHIKLVYLEEKRNRNDRRWYFCYDELYDGIY